MGTPTQKLMYLLLFRYSVGGDSYLEIDGITREGAAEVGLNLIVDPLSIPVFYSSVFRKIVSIFNLN